MKQGRALVSVADDFQGSGKPDQGGKKRQKHKKKYRGGCLETSSGKVMVAAGG